MAVPRRNSPAPAGTTVLISAFQPFAGRGVNGSSTVLKWLRRCRPALQREMAMQIHTCILPVDWRKAPDRWVKLLRRLHPAVILSIGEGKPDRIAWEMRAQNRTAGIDETGIPPADGQIQPKGPAELHSGWKIDPVQFSAQTSVSLRISNDAGVFLCNRILWESLAFRPDQAAFLHLPPQADTPAPAYAAQHGPVVVELLRSIS